MKLALLEPASPADQARHQPSVYPSVYVPHQREGVGVERCGIEGLIEGGAD